jgi:ubiquinone/menaquinone biosynthesis C-methylase UbiE
MVSPAERLAREIEFHRKIADRAEVVWTWDSPAGRYRARRRAELFIERCQLAPGRRALELGCGTGVFLEQVARSGADLTGLDLSPDLLERTRARLAGVANVTLECGNAEQTPFADATFDAIYGSSILHHLDLEHAVTEAARILRPGGRIAFAEPNALNPQVAVMFHVNALKPYFGVSADEMAFSRFAAARALRKAGYADIEVRPFDFVHPSLPPASVVAVGRLSRLLESLPVVCEIAGSLLITARRA